MNKNHLNKVLQGLFVPNADLSFAKLCGAHLKRHNFVSAEKQ